MKKAAKKSSSQADIGSRGTLWYFDPFELTIVGHDTDEQEHELCHHASNQFAAEQYREYIDYMRLNGVVKPIVFRRDGDRVLVVDGRTTTRVARVVAPLWEQDRKAEGIKGDDAKLRIPGVVRRGTADELFCASRAANRRRPEDPVGEQAKDVSRLVNNGATEEQAAARLGLPLARVKQLIAYLALDRKVQRRVGAGVSLDAAVKLAKLPAKDQIAKLDEIEKSGAKPTARAVTNKVREDTGKAPVETAAQKLKRIAVIIERVMGPLGEPCRPYSDLDAAGAASEIRAILSPPANGARPTNRDLHPEDYQGDDENAWGGR